MTTSEFKPDVLVVDDDRGMLAMLKDFYSTHGHRVLTAPNGTIAIRAGNQNHGKPTVALVDYNLPGEINGLDLLECFRRTCPHIASHMITGSSNKELIRRAKWSGAVDVFIKPLSEDDLRLAVQGPLIRRLTTERLYESLTGLLTRRAFEEMAKSRILITKRRKEELALLFIDVDDFKSINDQLGHLVGDAALQFVATCIKAHLRAYDHPCRWGGDEFAVLLAWVTQEDVCRISTNLKNFVREKPLVTSEGDVHLSISVGMAFLADGGDSFEDLVRRADKAMYDDKPSKDKKGAEK